MNKINITEAIESIKKFEDIYNKVREYEILQLKGKFPQKYRDNTVYEYSISMSYRCINAQPKFSSFQNYFIPYERS